MLTILEPHTALFVAPTGVGKTHLALDLLKRDYFDHFDFIVIICTTLRYSHTYHQRKWFWTNPYIIQIKPGNHLYDYIEKLGNFLAGSKTFFFIDDIIANENLSKQRNSLLDLAISGQHKGHSLWLLTQSFTAVPLNIRRQVKMLYVCHPKHRNKENDLIETPEESVSVKKQPKQGKRTCLVMRTEHPRDYEIR